MGEERIIPPPPRNRHRELGILDDLPDAVGLVLWQDARHLRDWAESPPDERRELFSRPRAEATAKRRSAVASAGELADALAAFAELKAAPIASDVRDVARGCEAIVEWAVEREHTRTAIEFAELAATVDPSSPKLANLAGRVTRNANDYDRAEVWFKRGIGLARESENIAEQVWGHLGYAKVCREQGWLSTASKHLNRGSRLAWKAGPPSLAASAQHDLLYMLMINGQLREAAEHAHRAFSWYPKNDPRIPFFAADVGLMLVLDRRFASAARLLRAALRILPQPSARVAVLALTARAFAGAGEPEEFAVFRSRALKLLPRHPGMEVVARWHLAEADLLRGAWTTARAEAEHAFTLATNQNDPELIRLSRSLLVRIAAEVRPKPGRGMGLELRELVQSIVTRVGQWSPRPARRWAGPWGSNRAA
jgi:tetratricopeptide (TPR) repeat protein